MSPGQIFVLYIARNRSVVPKIMEKLVFKESHTYDRQTIYGIKEGHRNGKWLTSTLEGSEVGI
jgi:hypothetical protein